MLSETLELRACVVLCEIGQLGDVVLVQSDSLVHDLEVRKCLTLMFEQILSN